MYLFPLIISKPDSVTQSDAHLTGGQKVRSPPGAVSFLH